eukprot:TRINITY_DN4013_c0_g1_i1.p1 TRINITY_DN4013_c0_g1~~TRINITY_DN4013_c0_g1_i1.p1  ORF type:complete len:54 (+),score=9.58 TRINITY_DN4013_c0_g1_i1:37-198(+)
MVVSRKNKIFETLTDFLRQENESTSAKDVHDEDALKFPCEFETEFLDGEYSDF